MDSEFPSALRSAIEAAHDVADADVGYSNPATGGSVQGCLKVFKTAS